MIGHSGTQPVNTIITTKSFNDTMDIFNPYFREPNVEVRIMFSDTSVSRFVLLINFEAPAFLQTSFKLTFGAKIDLIK